MVRKLYSHRELIFSFVKRSLLSRYRGSFLGLLWSFINPLFMLLIYTITFSFLFKIRPTSGGDIPYTIFLFTGMVPWIAFSEGLSFSTGVILANVNLVKKTVFPLEVLPVVATLTGFIHSLFALIILLGGILLMTHTLHWTLLLLPVVMIPQLIFTAGLCWLLASLGVFIRDMLQIIGLVLTGWMFMTPIMYPVELIPGRYRWIWTINPMYGVVEGYRDLLLHGASPHWKMLLLVTSAGVIFAILGYLWFMKTKKAFAEVV